LQFNRPLKFANRPLGVSPGMPGIPQEPMAIHSLRRPNQMVREPLAGLQQETHRLLSGGDGRPDFPFLQKLERRRAMLARFKSKCHIIIGDGRGIRLGGVRFVGGRFSRSFLRHVSTRYRKEI
jgi:hypothetical protein